MPSYGDVHPEHSVAFPESGFGRGEGSRRIARLGDHEGRVDGRIGDVGEREQEAIDLHDLGARDVGSPLPFGLRESQRDPLPDILHASKCRMCVHRKLR
jgi:hypothetical protein